MCTTGMGVETENCPIFKSAPTTTNFEMLCSYFSWYLAAPYSTKQSRELRRKQKKGGLETELT